MDLNSNQITRSKSVSLYRSASTSDITETLANEVRVALIYNGISHTVMMATPANLEQFAIGFTLSERIVDQLTEIKGVDIEEVDNGILIHIEITNRCFMALKEQRRSMAGRTGCGLCGVAQLEHAMKPVKQVSMQRRFNINYLPATLDAIAAQQSVFNETGATHAAMVLNRTGDICATFEDVGRHIALDKLIGAVARHDCPVPQAILLTSRASFEMVQKAASANIEIIFAISAATALAVELAEKCNITLVGFCRNNRATIYSHGERIDCDAAEQILPKQTSLSQVYCS